MTGAWNGPLAKLWSPISTRSRPTTVNAPVTAGLVTLTEPCGPNARNRPERRAPSCTRAAVSLLASTPGPRIRVASRGGKPIVIALVASDSSSP